MTSMEAYDLAVFHDVESGSDQQLQLERMISNLLDPLEGNAGSPDVMSHSLSDDDTAQDNRRGSSASSRKRKFSKNLLSERKRRQKLNEKLYSLRAIVPKITKMDKASIMADAIGYVEELKSQVSQLRREVTAIEEDLSNRSPNSSTLTTASPSSSLDEDHSQQQRKQQQQQQQEQQQEQLKNTNQNLAGLQMDVEKLDECRTCLVRIRCCPDLLAEIVATLESLDMEVLSASVNTFQGQMFTTYMAKMRDERLMHKGNLEGIVASAVLDSKIRA